MKSWLASLGVRFPKTHDLKRLIDLLSEHGAPTDGLDSFVDLNAFAVQYRYESLYSDEEAINRLEAVANIEALISQVDTVIRA